MSLFSAWVQGQKQQPEVTGTQWSTKKDEPESRQSRWAHVLKVIPSMCSRSISRCLLGKSFHITHVAERTGVAGLGDVTVFTVVGLISDSDRLFQCAHLWQDGWALCFGSLTKSNCPTVTWMMENLHIPLCFLNITQQVPIKVSLAHRRAQWMDWSRIRWLWAGDHFPQMRSTNDSTI